MIGYNHFLHTDRSPSNINKCLHLLLKVSWSSSWNLTCWVTTLLNEKKCKVLQWNTQRLLLKHCWSGHITTQYCWYSKFNQCRAYEGEPTTGCYSSRWIMEPFMMMTWHNLLQFFKHSQKEKIEKSKIIQGSIKF